MNDSRVVRLTPLARRIAAERGLDLRTLEGSGYEGKVYSYDLRATPRTRYTDAGSAAVKLDTYEVREDEFSFSMPEVPEKLIEFPVPEFMNKAAEADVSTEAMNRAMQSANDDVAGVMRMNEARRAIAEKTAKSSAETAAVTQHSETDVTELLALFRRTNENRDMRNPIPLTAFFIKAIAMCLREMSRFRLRLADTEDAYLMVEGGNVGLQVDAGESVFSPVVRRGDLKPLEEIASEIVALTEKAKRGALSEYDSTGGAITLIDKSETDVYAFTPIINQPEAAVLGIGSIYGRLVMSGGGIENRMFVMQSLTFDHRVLSGSEADEFQRRLNELLEKPQLLIG